jgi:hypothetical protein
MIEVTETGFVDVALVGANGERVVKPVDVFKAFNTMVIQWQAQPKQDDGKQAIPYEQWCEFWRGLFGVPVSYQLADALYSTAK